MKTIKILLKVPKKEIKEFVAITSLRTTKKGRRQHAILVVLESIIHKNPNLNINDLQSSLSKLTRLPQLRKDLHEITEELLIFLAKEDSVSNPLIYQNKLLDIIDKYEIDFILDDVYEKAFDLVKTQVTSSEELIHTYRIKKIGFERNMSIKSVQENFNRNGIKELNKLQAELSEYYEIESIKLGLMQHYIVFENRINDRSDLISTEIINPQKTENALLKLYRKLYMLVTKSSITLEEINVILEQLKNNKRLNIIDFRIISDGLTNLLNHHTNKGIRGLEVVQFELIKLGIQRGYYIEDIETLTYRNIIYFACSVKEYNWALEFSDDYKAKLPKQDQETAYSFNKARIYINMKQYDDVISTLRNVEYKDITFNLNSKLMLMVSFYELDEYETLLSTIRAFKVFLRRRRNVSVARKANFTGFCDALYNIMLADEKRESKRIWKAKEIIDANPAIPNTNWLLEKIEELKL